MANITSLSQTDQLEDTMMTDSAVIIKSSSNHFSAGHSRNSSAASSSSMPITPSVFARGHHRWSSSTSTLATTPDSPVSMAKPALHDLVEDPAEREDALHGLSDDLLDETLCICDTTFCEHRQPIYANPAAAALSNPEWSAGDEYLSECEWNSEPSLKRRRSGDCPTDGGIAARLSRRFPSLSRRNKREPSSLYLPRPGHLTIHSAPASRAPSIKSVPARRPYPPPSERGSNSSLVHFPLIENESEQDMPTPPRASSSDNNQLMTDVDLSDLVDEPIDRRRMTTTPLLPPMMDEHRDRLSGGPSEIVSPLQSPTIAAEFPPVAAATTPVLPSYPTPPLSAKPSIASFHPTRATKLMPDVLPMSLSDDPWAPTLGHANFHIHPEPYMPAESTVESCKRLLEDWEAARSEYLRHAVRISEHHGPTSRIYQLSEEKWASIDAEWRTFHERANADVLAQGEALVFQPLAENQPTLSKIPTLNDPSHPSKFPRIEDTEIVGPMVQYAKVQARPSKKKAFLRIFTDRASLLGGLRK